MLELHLRHAVYQRVLCSSLDADHLLVFAPRGRGIVAPARIEMVRRGLRGLRSVVARGTGAVVNRGANALEVAGPDGSRSGATVGLPMRAGLASARRVNVQSWQFVCQCGHHAHEVTGICAARMRVSRYSSLPALYRFAYYLFNPTQGMRHEA